MKKDNSNGSSIIDAVALPNKFTFRTNIQSTHRC